MCARLSGQFVRQGVDEVILPRIAGEVGERQHDYRETRGLGRRLRGDACGQVRAEEIPGGCRNHHEQRRERGGEPCESGTPLPGGARGGGHGLRRFRRLRLCRDPNLQRISANCSVNVLELGRAEIGDLHPEPCR